MSTTSENLGSIRPHEETLRLLTKDQLLHILTNMIGTRQVMEKLETLLYKQNEERLGRAEKDEDGYPTEIPPSLCYECERIYHHLWVRHWPGLYRHEYPTGVAIISADLGQ